ncbi:single-strand selective monofunctional uracil DNA glycosylase [Periplaneta americana]|uniref:single-strand selective monofunctional uracil DNA glycosylase n=1 Tax=Periplaneta americana TaxID=6978 RepID=UPI0037E93786
MADLNELPDKIPDKLLGIELLQTTKLNALEFSKPIEYIYNPLTYAFDIHSNFVRKFCQSTKKILFLGMNPGPWGMSQTGVPFGEVDVVKGWLRVSGNIGRPVKEHPSRQVLGLECKRSEVSGRKFWGLFQNICGDPAAFFQVAFVYNYCPLAFMTSTGKNITPAELKSSDRQAVNEICDETLRDVLELLQVEVLVGIGRYAEDRAKKALAGTELLDKVKVVSISHPSPRNFSSKNWREETTQLLEELGLLAILCPSRITVPE